MSVFEPLETSSGFFRDSRVGGLLHPGKVSLREISDRESLHISLGEGNRVSVHVDRICPVAVDAGGRQRYSPLRVAAHVVADVIAGVGHGRCELVCDAVEVSDGLDATGSAPVRVPFTPIDEAVHLLDDPAEPWTIEVEARVAGRLDEARLRAAVAAAVARHPLARARRVPDELSPGRFEWEIVEGGADPVRVVACPDDDALAAARSQLASAPVSLADAPPVRVWLARHPDGDAVLLSLHHAAGDGVAALRLLRSIARSYAGDDDPLPDVDPLAVREGPAGVPAPTGGRWRRRLALAERLRDLASPPARVVAERAAGRRGYGVHHVRLSADDTAALGHLDHPGTVNDVLVAALHLAVADWNAEHGAPTRRVAVLVAANLRPRAWWHEVVGNFSLFARVSTAGRHRVSTAAALQAVTAQTGRKKRTGLGTALVELLRASPAVPLRAKRAVPAALRLTGNRLVDTALLSNLGVVDPPPSFGPDAGPTTELWFSPPARMPLGVAVGAVTAGGRLHLSFRYRRAQFGPEAARRFARYYQAALDRLVRLTPGAERSAPPLVARAG